MSRIEIPVTMATKLLVKAISAIQKETEAATLEALSAKDGIVVLHPIDRDTARIVFDPDELLHTDDSGNRMHAYRRRIEPESWRNSPHMRGHWNPAYWDINLTRFDASGRKWTTDLGRHVVDDFGDMVCVEGVAP